MHQGTNLLAFDKFVGETKVCHDNQPASWFFAKYTVCIGATDIFWSKQYLVGDGAGRRMYYGGDVSFLQVDEVFSTNE